MIILFSNCASIGLVIQDKESFSLKPEKLSEKRIFIEYDLKMNIPRKSRMMQMKQSLENIIIDNNNFTEYALLPKTDKERDNSKYDYKIVLSSKSKDSFSWYFLLYFVTIGLIPVRTLDTDYDIFVAIQNSQGQLIYEKGYKNTYSFYLAIYTFLNILEFQHSQKQYFDYQMQKIVYDLTEKKLNLK